MSFGKSSIFRASGTCHLSGVCLQIERIIGSRELCSERDYVITHSVRSSHG